MSQSLRRFSIGRLDAVSVLGKDEKTYTLIANFLENEESLPETALQNAVSLTEGSSAVIAPGAAVLLQSEGALFDSKS
jgi:hypothetical protein